MLMSEFAARKATIKTTINYWISRVRYVVNVIAMSTSKRISAGVVLAVTNTAELSAGSPAGLDAGCF